ncbi:MAG: hypothetical protein F4Z29_10145 [Gemmatimonadetes bacterium]|nr:hypothetical protein [Gemmatimonadota bacterium]
MVISTTTLPPSFDKAAVREFWPQAHGGDTEVRRGRLKHARRRTLHFPQGITPIHYVRNWDLVRELTHYVEQHGAEDIPPILIDRGQLLTGTHRWVANELLSRRGKTPDRIRVVELENFPSQVRDIIRELWEEGRLAQLQAAFHVMIGAKLKERERKRAADIPESLWAISDPYGTPLQAESNFG